MPSGFSFGIEKILKIADKLCRCAYLTFPNNEAVPSQSPQFPFMLGVPGDIPLQFGQPISLIRARRSLDALVLMPEASVNEYDLLPHRKHQVWLSGKVRAVKSETVAERMHQTAND